MIKSNGGKAQTISNLQIYYLSENKRFFPQLNARRNFYEAEKERK